MASTINNNISGLSEDVNKLKLTTNNKQVSTTTTINEKNDTNEPHLSGFETRELYRIAINFYKEKEGKAVHLSYEDKLKLMAFTQQAIHGKCTPENSPPLGVLDVIGKDRRLAWQNLGDISKEEAMEGFVVLLDKLCPLFRTVVEAQKRNIQEQERRQKEEEIRKIEQDKIKKQAEEERKREEEERQKSEYQRRQIQEALNQQTFYQFKAYAEQQYPGNPEQQGVLIRQLQEQHYHRYMQQLHQNRLMIEENNDIDSKKKKEEEVIQRSDDIRAEEKKREAEGEEEKEEKSDDKIEKKKIINNSEENEDRNRNDDDDDDEDEDSDAEPDWPHIASPKMWTRHGVEKFKNDIRNNGGDAVIKIGHGETVTVRVPTHEDGACVFWEFATDGYDIGFGVYFEWSKPDTNQVSVHISESEDDDDEQDFDSREDLECGEINEDLQSEFKPSTPPISVIIPVFRRDSQEEVYAGSHEYPGHGVYLLKFDNSYSLWRSKTLYYKVYYTKPGFTNNQT